MEQALEKIGEINWTEIEGAKLVKLDPSIPYIISLPKSTTNTEVERITAFFGQANIHATVIVGDPKDFKIFGSFPWFTVPRFEVLSESKIDRAYREGSELPKSSLRKKSITKKKAVKKAK